MDIKDIVMKLIGPVQPLGEHNSDIQRLKNMENLIELTDYLLDVINTAAASAERPEASMKAIGQVAKQFLDDVRRA